MESDKIGMRSRYLTIRGDDGDESVLGVGKDFGNDTSRCRGDDGGDDGEEPRCCHGREGVGVD